MGLAEDFLDLAEHLATHEGSHPGQASLRRAVSTAYYALFHLLIGDAADRWTGAPEARVGFRRAFDHGYMRSVSDEFEKGTWKDWSGNKPRIPPDLKSVARAFVNLQRARHKADYGHEQ